MRPIPKRNNRRAPIVVDEAIRADAATAMTRRRFAGALAGIAAALAHPARAEQLYPARVVTLLVPFPAGSATDSVARKLAEGLRAAFNSPSSWKTSPAPTASSRRGRRRAPSRMGTRSSSRQTPRIRSIANIYTSLPYDPEKDFAPVGGIMKIPMVLAVRADLPATTSRGSSSSPRPKSDLRQRQHVEPRRRGMFKARAGLEMLHVPYRGTPQAITDRRRHHRCDVSDPSSALGPIKGRQLKMLAVAARGGSTTLPDVPTIAESGYPGFEMVAWVGASFRRGPRRDYHAAERGTEQDPRPEDTLDYFDTSARRVPDDARRPARYAAEDTKRWAEIVDIGKIERKTNQ